MSVLGKFGVIMADPPWEIHQDLPYGTMADEEMRRLNIGVLQDDGVIFLWVTGGLDAPAAAPFTIIASWRLPPSFCICSLQEAMPPALTGSCTAIPVEARTMLVVMRCSSGR